MQSDIFLGTNLLLKPILFPYVVFLSFLFFFLMLLLSLVGFYVTTIYTLSLHVSTRWDMWE